MASVEICGPTRNIEVNTQKASVYSVAGKNGNVILDIYDINGLTEALTSGVAFSGYATETDLIASGFYLENLIYSVSGNISGGTITGDYYPNNNPSGFITSSQTGFLSGVFYPTNSNPSGYLTIPTANGIYASISTTNGLQFQINSLSGQLSHTGNLTGVFYPLTLNPSNYLTLSSGNSLYATTGNLNSLQIQVNNISGLIPNTGILTGSFYPLNNNPLNYVNQTQLNTLSGNLDAEIKSTGSYLVTLVNSLSGSIPNSVNSINGQNGSLTFSGGGNVSISNSGNFFTILGDTGIYSSFVTTGQTGVFNSIFATQTSLNNTGNYLYSLIQASSAGVSSLNLLSGSLNITGAGNVTVSSSGQLITVYGETGILTGKFYPLLNNPSNYLTSSSTGFLSGVFYSISNPSGFINSSSLSPYATLVNLNNQTSGLTGLILINSGNISSLQSQTGNYYLSSNPSNFVTNIQTGNLTGQFYPLSSNPSNYSTVSELNSTGNYLYSLISASSAGVGSLNGLSGLINISGIGSVSVNDIGNNIIISGSSFSDLSWSYQITDFTGISNNGYIFNQITGITSMYLPATFNLGSVIKVIGRGSGVNGLWKISQGPGQQIFFGNSNTTLGNSGYLLSNNPRNCIDLLQVDSREWQVVSSIGNIQVF